MLICNQNLINLTDFALFNKAIVNIHKSTCFIPTFFFCTKASQSLKYISL